MIIKIHRFLGIVLVFFVLVLSVTGTLLQHAEDFKIRQTYASSTFAKNVYGIKPCVISSAPISSKWISICNNNLYFEEKRIVNNITTLRAAFKKNDNYVILYDGHIITVSSSGEIIDLGHTETPKNVKISLEENILPGNLKKDKIENFLIFDEKNGSSIFECIRKARSNIKMVRTAVTLEVWNAVNSTFHDIEKFSEKKYSSRDLPGIIDFVKSRVNLIRGTIQNTQLIDDTFDFLSIGTYVERADFTARIIDVKYFILLPSSNYVGSQIDNFQWTLMLRSVSAYRGFKQTYGNNGVNHINIIEFLILDMTCPRSLMFSLDKISSHLTNLKKIYKKNSKAEEEISLIVKKFKKLSAKKILNIGLHEFLLEFIRKLYSVNSNLQNNYFFGKEK